LKKTFAETFPSGEVRADVTSLTLVNNTAKTQDVTVADDTLWVLQSIKASNPDDVARTVQIRLYKEAAKTNLIALLASVSVSATSQLQFPSYTGASGTLSGQIGFPLTLFPGNTISITWSAGGASAGGTDADGQVIFYRRLLKT